MLLLLGVGDDIMMSWLSIGEKCVLQH